MWPRPFPLSMYIVGSVAVDLISLALDLETELIAVGEWESSIFRAVISCVDIAISWPIQASTNNHGSEDLGGSIN
jgi:hypothetical protein